MKFAGIKAGDTVVESCHPCHGPGLLRQVERVTKAQIILSNSSARYRKVDGRMIGDFRAGHLMPATPELVGKIRQHARIANAKGRLRRLDYLGTLTENTAKLLSALPHIEAAIAALESPAPNPDASAQIPLPLNNANE
jgi:hypothetical protein